MWAEWWTWGLLRQEGARMFRGGGGWVEWSEKGDERVGEEEKTSYFRMFLVNE